MKKKIYETPLSEAMEMAMDSATMLYGSPGQPGGDLTEKDPLNLAPETFDSILF